MANANFTSIDPSQFDRILQDLSISQMLSDDAGKMALGLYYETDIDAVGTRVQSIAAVCKQSVSLNAGAHEKLQEIFDAITASAASPQPLPQS
jgi:hypothetical protein